MNVDGEEIKGELHSTDASSGVEITLYNQGSLTARTLTEDEYIEVHSIEAIAAVTGDLHVFIGADATPGAGETVVRGVPANNGGILKSIIKRTGRPGHKPFVIAAAGVVDVVFNGVIRKVGRAVRPNWREAENL
jgi:hypothetical protein